MREREVNLPIKTLIPIDGITVIQRTVEVFLAEPTISHVVVVVPPKQREVFLGLNFPSAVSCVDGGSTRSASVLRGLEWCEVLNEPPDLVVIHDGARCLITRDLLSLTIATAIEAGAAIAAIPSTDTLHIVDENLICRGTYPRDAIWRVQTPQVLPFKILLKAHRDTSSSATDDASLLFDKCQIKVVLGEQTNIKITTPEDLILANAIISQRKR
jgi:2-C-methyl-D-erythritol 4-phosphate cytidylyltransferase